MTNNSYTDEALGIRARCGNTFGLLPMKPPQESGWMRLVREEQERAAKIQQAEGEPK